MKLVRVVTAATPTRVRWTAALEALILTRKHYPWRLLTHTIILFALTLAARAQGPAYPYSVALPFTASTGTGITGYNMYRAPWTTTCGTFSKLNATPFSAPPYTDSAPPQGHYCYEATALAGTDESGPSNVVSGVIIPPVPPTGLGATVAQVPGGYTGRFIWTASTDSVDGYTVGISNTHGGPYTKQLIVQAPTTHVTTGMSAGTKYAVAWSYKGTDKGGPTPEIVVNVP